MALGLFFMKKKHEVSIKPLLDKKKILLVSRWGESLDLAYAMFLEGHSIKFYIEDKGSKEIGLGFVWVVPTQRSLGLGALLLNHIHSVVPKLWLTIEDLSLKDFYTPLGYVEYAHTPIHQWPIEKLFII